MMSIQKQPNPQAKYEAYLKFFWNVHIKGNRMDAIIAKKLPDYRQVFDSKESSSICSNDVLSFNHETGKIEKNNLKEGVKGSIYVTFVSYLRRRLDYINEGQPENRSGIVRASALLIAEDKSIWKWLEYINRLHKAPNMHVRVLGYWDRSQNGVYAIDYSLMDMRGNGFIKHPGEHMLNAADLGLTPSKDVLQSYQFNDPNCGIVLVSSTKEANHDAQRLASYLRTIGIPNVSVFDCLNNAPKPSLTRKLRAMVQVSEKGAFGLIDDLVKAHSEIRTLKTELNNMKAKDAGLSAATSTQ